MTDALYASSSMTPDRLIAGIEGLIPEEGYLAAGAGELVRGQVLAQITKGAASASACVGTGNGVCGDNTVLADQKVGTYLITCIAITDDDPVVVATFSVLDPDGFRLEDALDGVPYAHQIGFEITEGLTPFALGDYFEVTIAAAETDADGRYLWGAALSTAVDGLQEACGILAEPEDASGEDDVVTSIYTAGDGFDVNSLVFTGEDTIDDHRESLRAHGIVLRASVEHS